MPLPSRTSPIRMCPVSTSWWPIRRASSKDISITVFTRDVGMMLLTRTLSCLPTAPLIMLRTGASVMPSSLKTTYAAPFSTRIRPSSRCSVPMYEWCERSASSGARVSVRLPSSVKRSNGYIACVSTSLLSRVNERLFVQLELVKLDFVGSSLDLFAPSTRDWFLSSFAAPTQVQERGWQEVASGRHVLMAAPTGSGKTLAAFLWCLDRLTSEPVPVAAERCRVLYVSPMKALAHDVDRNLRSPLVGLRHQIEAAGGTAPDITVAIRTGDTPTDVRRSMERHPPDILITTPESLFLLLTSAARRILASVRWVIVDEIHSVAATKRGSHLALSLERLCALTKVEPQRIGLSATQRPLEEVGRFLGGTDRDVAIVDAGRLKTMEVRVEVPVDDMARLAVEDETGKTDNRIWPE